MENMLERLLTHVCLRNMSLPSWPTVYNSLPSYPSAYQKPFLAPGASSSSSRPIASSTQAPPKMSSAVPKAHPPLGTIIDNGAYELVEVLGVGGYGVVYRAVDARTPYPRSYAV